MTPSSFISFGILDYFLTFSYFEYFFSSGSWITNNSGTFSFRDVSGFDLFEFWEFIWIAYVWPWLILLVKLYLKWEQKVHWQAWLGDILEAVIVVGCPDTKAGPSFVLHLFTCFGDRILGIPLSDDFLGLEVFLVVSDAEVFNLDGLLDLFLVDLWDNETIMLMGEFMVVEHLRLVEGRGLLFNLEVISGIPKLL